MILNLVTVTPWGGRAGASRGNKTLRFVWRELLDLPEITTICPVIMGANLSSRQGANLNSLKFYLLKWFASIIDNFKPTFICLKLYLVSSANLSLRPTEWWSEKLCLCSFLVTYMHFPFCQNDEEIDLESKLDTVKMINKCFNLFFKKIRSVHRMQVPRPTKCRSD